MSAEENRFYYHAKKYLKEEFPEEVARLSETELEKRINVGLKTAHQYHLSSETEAMSFIDMDFRFKGILTDKNPPDWAKEVLSEERLTPEEKIGQLQEAYGVYFWLKEAEK